MDSFEKYENLIINDQYKLLKIISQGSFGIVFLGQDIIKGNHLAIKMEREDVQANITFQTEINHLNMLQDNLSFPRLYWHGKQGNQQVIVQNLLGKDMGYYMRKQGRISLNSCILLLDQLLILLQNLHEKSIIHRDIKPENILMGKQNTEEQNKVYLIDFGISKIYRDQNQKIIPQRKNKHFVGTSRYASIDSHLGYEQSPKCDLESLFYVILFFINGYLPWQNLQNIQEKNKLKVIGELKQSITYEDLCKGLPYEFIQYIRYVRSLQYDEIPNYSYLQNLFKQLGNTMNINYKDIHFEWVKKKSLCYNIHENKCQQTGRSSQQLLFQVEVSNENNNSEIKEQARGKANSIIPSLCSITKFNQYHQQRVSQDVIYFSSYIIQDKSSKIFDQDENDECIDEYYKDFPLDFKFQYLMQNQLKYYFK